MSATRLEARGLIGDDGPMLHGVLVELHVTCRGCRTSVPPNGVVEAVACHSCGRRNDLPDSFWRKRFDKEDFEPWLLAPSKSESSAHGSADGIESHLRYAMEMPLCLGCRKPLALDGALEAGAITCGCGKENRVRAADPRTKLIDKRAVMVVGETARPIEQVRKPVVFACMKCGGTLEVDGKARTIACTYCTASNYLPDGVWQVIYPVPQLEVFYVVCEYSADQMREVRWSDYEVRMRDAARPDLTPELYGQLSHDDDEQVREALASNPKVDPGLVGRLARDEDDDVRAAAAKNPSLPEDVLVELAGTDDYPVIEALITRPDLPARVVEALARSKRAESRVHAIQHPNLPLATLRELSKKDEDDSIKRKAKARIAELEKQGVEVPGGGLFSKLFG